MHKNTEYIFVDLDGTLIRSDLFFESFLQLLKRNPLSIFQVVCWILQGRSYTKERLANRVDLCVQQFQFEESLLNYLKEQKNRGRKIVLATASHRLYAEKVAAHLGIFEGVIATDAANNLKGRRKLEAIWKYAEGADFCYAGDSPADRPIWEAAASNILVNARRKDITAAETENKIEKLIISRPPVWRAFLKEMRPHQYAKNTLIFVPLFTSHGYLNLFAFYYSLLAFVCFSLCASGVYFLNDLLDLESDRQHASKRSRPLASGDLSIHAGIVGASILPLAAFVLAAAFLPMNFVWVLAIYFLITNAYSFVLKRISTADVMTLALLYTSRVVAGAAATAISLSSWLIAFSVFVFVSLAYLKRYIEIASLPENSAKAHGREYSGCDSETMFSLGTANITGSVMLLALYINSPEVISAYRSPEILWLLCLLMLYWSNRIWVGARRGKIADDPVVFAIKDNVSRMVGVAFLIFALMAKYVEL